MAQSPRHSQKRYISPIDLTSEVDIVTRHRFEKNANYIFCEVKQEFVTTPAGWTQLSHCPYCQETINETQIVPSGKKNRFGTLISMGLIGGIAIVIGLLLWTNNNSSSREPKSATSTIAIDNDIIVSEHAPTMSTAENEPIQESTLTKAPSPSTATPRPSRTPSQLVSSTATPQPSRTPVPPNKFDKYSIGQSPLGKPIEVAQFGYGSNAVILVGGLHAGFAPSTVALMDNFITHFKQNVDAIPPDITLYIIRNANPDSVYDPGNYAGRINSNSVDLNRNWDCNWKADASWRQASISGGTAPFSEPETVILKEFILSKNSIAVLFWEAKAANGLIVPGGCPESAASTELSSFISNTTGYPEGNVSYEVNGDAANWLDSKNIPSVAILLNNYASISENTVQKNLNAVEAILNK